MNPLLAVAVRIFPEILGAIAGDKTERVAREVVDAVRSGTREADPAGAEAAVAADPVLAAKLRGRLAEIALQERRMQLEAEERKRADMLKELQARLDADAKARRDALAHRKVDAADTGDARGLQRELVSSNSPVAWVAPTLSIVVTIGFFFVIVVFVFFKNRLEVPALPVQLPGGVAFNELSGDQIQALSVGRSDFVIQILNISVGALSAAFATVMSFWLGSSQGSRNKDDVAAKIQVEQQKRTTEVIERAIQVGPPSSPPPADEDDVAPDDPDAPTSGPGAKPAPPGLHVEVASELAKPHGHFKDGVRWALVAGGVSVEGAAPERTPGEPATLRRIWKAFGEDCARAAKTYGVPVELIVATIATESDGRPNARRPEPKLGTESVGLMQTLVTTAREALGRGGLRADDLLDPRVSVEAGTAYIAQQRGSTHFDPPLVAAAYNAGSLRPDGGSKNRWKLRCHPIGTGAHIDRFLSWFGDAMHVCRTDGWNRDGDVPSFAALFGTGSQPEPARPAAAEAPSADFPPRPAFAALRGAAAKHDLFGAFKVRRAPRPDDPEAVEILGDWVKENIVTVDVPVRRVLGRDGPMRMRFHKAAADQLIAMWLAWEREELLDLIVSADGDFVPRFMRGETASLSSHAFGVAFDINAASNPLGATPPAVGRPGSVRLLVPIANAHGFFWGGHFRSRLDGMHFEVAKLL